MNQGSPLLHSLFATIAENVEVPVEVVYPRDLDHYVNTHLQQLEGLEILPYFSYDEDEEVHTDVV